MFLDPMVDRGVHSLGNYPDVVEYLTNGRGFTLDELKKFRIGYTANPFLPETRDPEEEEFLEETKRLYYLQHKIWLPLENSMGLVNGLITRDPQPDAKFRYKQYYLREAKRIGSFFGLRQALPHIIETGVVYVTEGSFDCMAVARHFPNVVSTLTSFINEEQMYVLRMLADKIVMVFDPDGPGRKGVQLVTEKFGSKGLYSREFGRCDPNKYLVDYGDEQFKKQLKKSLGSLLAF